MSVYYYTVLDKILLGGVLMKQLNLFVYSIFAGVSIAIGGVVYLACDDKVTGSIFFTLGLFTVCVNGYNLYTGKVGYLFDNKPSYLLTLAIIWLGNLVGSLIVGNMIRMTRMATLIAKAKTVSMVKLNDNLLSIFLLAILCGLLMCIAVDSFKNNPHEIGKYIGLFMCVPVFILSSYEHCVANMFYFTVADVWSPNTILYLLVMTLGNGVGGVLLPVARMLKVKSEAIPSTAGKR